MALNWNNTEIEACVRSYLWMLKGITEGYNPIKKRVREALIQGPLSKRSHGSLEYRFQNISAVLASQNKNWIKGYIPAKNVGSGTSDIILKFIDSYSQHRHNRRLNWMIKSLPNEIVRDAAEELALGKVFDYPDSTDYDLDFNGIKMPPKKVIGYAGLLYFGSPLFSENFSGGEETPCFHKLSVSGLRTEHKSQRFFYNTEDKDFRKQVAQNKNKVLDRKPKGNLSPIKRNQNSVVYDRDPSVVSFVENRANGICELCSNPAPFERKDGTPFLEVHHIVPLSENGSDTVDNAVAICPNCHRSCHHGVNANEIRKLLKVKVLEFSSKR